MIRSTQPERDPADRDLGQSPATGIRQARWPSRSGPCGRRRSPWWPRGITRWGPAGPGRAHETEAPPRAGPFHAHQEQEGPNDGFGGGSRCRRPRPTGPPVISGLSVSSPNIERPSWSVRRRAGTAVVTPGHGVSSSGPCAEESELLMAQDEGFGGHQRVLQLARTTDSLVPTNTGRRPFRRFHRSGCDPPPPAAHRALLTPTARWPEATWHLVRLAMTGRTTRPATEFDRRRTSDATGWAGWFRTAGASPGLRHAWESGQGTVSPGAARGRRTRTATCLRPPRRTPQDCPGAIARH